MYRSVFMWEKARVGCFKRTASKHVYYLGWNWSPAQVGCMRQVLGPGALGRPRGIRWRGRWEGESGWRIHVNPWLIHVNVWQKPLQYCKVISLQLIKVNEKKIQILLLIDLEVKKSHQLKSSCQQSYLPSAHSGKWSISLPFPASRCYPDSFAHSDSASTVTSFSLNLILLLIKVLVTALGSGRFPRVISSQNP